MSGTTGRGFFSFRVQKMTASAFERKIDNYISLHSLVSPGEKVAVGLSGGADSVTLLLVLKKLGCSVTAVHVNHCLRGEESDGDEAFVRRLCGAQNIPLRVYSYDVRRMASETGTGIEEAGRLARHRAYLDATSRGGAAAVALAHHADDQAETFLFHAARGSSLKGLAGISPDQKIEVDAGDGSRRPVRLIRPLLCVTRSEIESYLKEIGQPFRTDSTNLSLDGARNRLRNDVMPYLKQHINAAAAAHFAQAAEDIARADSCLRAEAASKAEGLVQKSEGQWSVDDGIVKLPEILEDYILMEILAEACGSAKDLGRTQIRQLRELFRKKSGSRLDLPCGVTACRDYGCITLIPAADRNSMSAHAAAPCGVRKTDGKDAEASGASPQTDAVRITGEGTYQWNGWRFSCRYTDRDALDPEKIKPEKYTKFLDYDKIKNSLVVRKRLRGDRITVRADGASKKLSDYFIDEKIPARERDDIPVLASGADVFWVVGLRISEDCRVTAGTERVLRISAEKL